uniref:protein disulfide-isomerase n=1 Tax=Chlamydomonas leiostraca TaxID=1034604 RepID=A0A7S0R6G9_9CHLO|mmetsp:Transcript_14915/g.37206  ORF Transcript_14915/g.37206 Transcript_14915/m.37206 type:complete len:819 (+) Transcript_14915:89-2545(+)|eukprot:CAMPEP_0202862236 /NCGR_PEP_ID=MMETSP1391-20130828/3349_1 /ASSEMBLY_ACC=CAM_ASM_000867 /TAXON_ID=1034604 /ORGANISM="Chlamydomonas leiostraca, Strain SAG 11-49" /LENGTH=818 /DNA_ID=CAMNT_0049541747 /DNA_START=85 /DNA_END=2541 /DNA_ORIENTATION=-
MRAGVAAALLLACLASAQALYSSKDNVVTLTEKNFDELVHQGDAVVAVEFYAPWCGHCKALAPHWKKVATNLAGMAVVGAVDCDDKGNARLCASHEIQSFPTIKIFGAQKTKNPYTGAITRVGELFWGTRTAKPIVDAVIGAMTDQHIRHLKTSEELAAFRGGSEVSKVVLLTEKAETTALYKALSMQLHAGLDFAQVYLPLGKEVAAALEVEGPYPALLVIKAEGGGVERYEGELKAPALLDFLAGFSDKAKASSSDKKKEQAKAGGKEKPDKVKTLSWEEAVGLDAKEDMALLALLAGGSEACAEAEKAFRAAAADMQEVVAAAVVHVEGAQLEQAARYGADVASIAGEAGEGKCAQRVVLLPFGAEKAELDDYAVYSGGALEGKALQAWVTAAMPAFTTEVTPHNLQYFLSATAPIKPRSGDDDDDEDDEELGADALGKPMPPKLLLFTNKDEAPGVYKALALNFRQHSQKGVAFGWVRAGDDDNKGIVANMKPRTIPGLMMMIPMPQQLPNGQIQFQMGGQHYHGPLKYNSIAQWVEGMLSLLGQMAGVKPGADVEVPELAGDADLQAHCVDKGAGVCIIGLMDPASGHHASAAAALKAVAGKRAGEPLHFSTLDARKYRSFLSALGVLASDTPTVVALSASRMRYAAMPTKLGASDGGAAGEAVLDKFVDGVLGGRVRTQPLQELPRLVAGEGDAPGGSSGFGGSDHGDAGEADSGQCTMPPPGATPGSSCGGGGEEGSNAVAEPVEDEFDLSDIMSEEVSGEAALSNEEKLRRIEEQLKEEEAAAKKAAKKSKKKSKKKKSSKKKGGEDGEL